MRTVYLEFHDDAANSHKFYRVTFQGSGEALIEWGRVGAGAQSQVKSHGEAENKLNEKIAKGYREVRSGHVTPKAKAEVFPVKKSAKRKVLDEVRARTSVDIWDELARQPDTRRAK